ncbi:MAG: hypothetical protein U5O16_25165 [Rhodococcus sp. (in: high G+C Gram-positive bacteria)]|uniref:hypothetical protein n=1 Tax=Rhodococcus sp. TaxID=1831 RepID=UPI002ADC80BC|nr:hypothetical protein [Rhodococcus sp. (in: high G+C Gram-positive bacteria)]
MTDLVSGDASEDGLLDELDRELESAIVRLNHQRHMISRARPQLFVGHDACAS